MSIPALRFKGFDGDWRKVNIQTLINDWIIDPPVEGNYGKNHPSKEDYQNDGIPFINAKDVVNGQLVLHSAKKINKSQVVKLRRGSAVKGDILLTHKATLGNVAQVPELPTTYIILGPQVTRYRIVNNEKLTSDFLQYTFESPNFKNQLSRSSAGLGVAKTYISLAEQSKLTLSYPSIDEQNLITSFFKTVDEKLSLMSKEYHLIQQYKLAMIDKIFCGQYRFQDDNGTTFVAWRNIKLKDVGEIVTGGTPMTTNKDFCEPW